MDDARSGEAPVPWHGVPKDMQDRWNEIFAATCDWLQIPEPCPVCGAYALHLWLWPREPREGTIKGKR